MLRETTGKSLFFDIKSSTVVISLFPSFPPGWDLAKSSLLKFLASSKATAIASPKARDAVVLVVGARSNGQASSEMPVSKFIKEFLAMKESLEPVIEKNSQPDDLRKGIRSIISSVSPE